MLWILVRSNNNPCVKIQQNCTAMLIKWFHKLARGITFWLVAFLRWDNTMVWWNQLKAEWNSKQTPLAVMIFLCGRKFLAVWIEHSLTGLLVSAAEGKTICPKYTHARSECGVVFSSSGTVSLRIWLPRDQRSPLRTVPSWCGSRFSEHPSVFCLQTREVGVNRTPYQKAGLSDRTQLIHVANFSDTFPLLTTWLGQAN